MSHLRYDTMLDGLDAADARVAHPVPTSAMQMPQLLRRSNWTAIAAVDLTCGFSTAMKAHERRPREGSS